MTNPIGIDIIKSNMLPVEFYNEKTKEKEISHMIQIGNTLYVSEEVFNGITEQFDGDVE